jgi:hypothetical protein
MESALGANLIATKYFCLPFSKNLLGINILKYPLSAYYFIRIFILLKNQFKPIF